MARSVLSAALLTLGPALASSTSDARDTFVVAESKRLDASQHLRWTFQIDDVKDVNVKSLVGALEAQGFSEVGVPENDEENDVGVYSIWFSDFRVHTVASLAARIDVISTLLRKHGGKLGYQSVEQP